MSISTAIAKASGSKAEANIIVNALAGTGKTTTLIEGLKVMKGLPTDITPSEQQQQIWDALCAGETPTSVNFVAFNKDIAAELSRRVPVGCSAMTLHQMGFSAIRKNFTLNKQAVNGYRTQNILEMISGVSFWDLKKNKPEYVAACVRLTSLSKLNLLEPTAENLDHLASYYDVDLGGYQEEVFDMVPLVLERCKQVDKDGYIDFDDMVWLPVALDLPCQKYDLLLWDECQDGNRCQQALVKKCGHRLLLCGDVNQAIYGFAGADAESMERMYTELDETKNGVEIFPLTVTRRCGEAIVQEARKYVKNFEAHEDNSEGEVLTMNLRGKEGYLNELQSGDMILCRNNAPLVSECFKILKMGMRASIRGRDIGKGLVNMIKKLYKTEQRENQLKTDEHWEDFFTSQSVIDFGVRLEEWTMNELNKERAKKNPNDHKIESYEDREMCLQFFAQGAQNIKDITDSIARIFTDKSARDAVNLSSIHKSKGLEANRVFMLDIEGAYCPSPYAKTDWQRVQERNLRYVEITRAKHTLVKVVE